MRIEPISRLLADFWFFSLEPEKLEVWCLGFSLCKLGTAFLQYLSRLIYLSQRISFSAGISASSWSWIRELSDGLDADPWTLLKADT